jgi:hypothetical protein
MQMQKEWVYVMNENEWMSWMNELNEWVEWMSWMNELNEWVEWISWMNQLNERVEWKSWMNELNEWVEWMNWTNEWKEKNNELNIRKLKRTKYKLNRAGIVNWKFSVETLKIESIKIFFLFLKLRYQHEWSYELRWNVFALFKCTKRKYKVLTGEKNNVD